MLNDVEEERTSDLKELGIDADTHKKNLKTIKNIQTFIDEYGGISDNNREDQMKRLSKSRKDAETDIKMLKSERILSLQIQKLEL